MSPRLRTLLMTTTALLALAPKPGAAGPDGATVVGGAASVAGAGTGNVTVNQTTERAIVNWNTFNIGTGESTRFVQPNTSSVVLNRVTGGLGASTIDGTLSANGKVFLVNRDGMLFGPNAVVNTAGFVATTHDIKNDDFMAGRYNFNIPGRPDASIVNQGHITATSGGFAALVAPGVRNTGTITATLGTVSLASGNMFTLDLYGDKLIQLGIGDEIAVQVRDVATGQPLKSLVSNEGKLRANGGRVELTAAAARQVVDSVINNKGVIEANSIGTRNGMIVLGAATSASKGAGAPKQTVRIGGTLSASGRKKGTSGGKIVVTGENIEVAGARIDASGDAGGGKVLIGGDWAGGNPTLGLFNNQSARLETNSIATATTLSVDSASTIDASARNSGDGGKVILWSEGLTTFAGTIFANGGSLAGNGGFVETSGHALLDFTGNVNTFAANGFAGTLLLDPRNVTVVSTGSDSMTNSGGTFTPDADNSIIKSGTLQTALNSGNVIVTTGASGSPGSQVGDITVNSQISWGANTTLTLSAFHDIRLNDSGPIAGTIVNTGAGNLVLRADNSGTGSGTIVMPPSTTATRVNWTGSTGTVTVYYNPTAFGTQDNFTTGNGRFLLASPSQLTAYMLVNNVTNLQNISSNLAGTYALGKNIDASGPTFAPIASIGVPFTGVLEGLNQTISNLTIAPTSASINNVGLFGVIGASGVARNLNITNATVTANPNVPSPGQFIGILAGTNGGTVSNVSVAGTVTNGAVQNGVIAGGLVGQNGIFGPNQSFGTITQSHSASNVTVGSSGTGAPNNNAGGLVGANPGTIANSDASGTIIGGTNAFVGGLVGTNGDSNASATITASSASGNVTGTGSVGGLIGFNKSNSSVTTSSASGNVSVSGNGFGGGLVGQNEGLLEGGTRTVGTITGTGTSAQSVSIGGLVGVNNSAGTVRNSSVTNATINGNFATAGGLVGSNSGLVTGTNAGQVFVSGVTLTLVGPASTGGGLVGSNAVGGTVHNASASGTIGPLNTVAASTFMTFGGLVGRNSGGIDNSTAATTVNGGAGWAGGLAGQNDGAITTSSASGNVSGTGVSTSSAVIGGLVGSNSSTGQIASSNSATGTVSTGGFARAGGLIGDNSASLSNLSTSNPVNASGLFVSIGGLIGWNNLGATITNGRASGNVTSSANGVSQFDMTVAGGLIGTNLGSIASTTLPTANAACAGASFSCASGAVSVGSRGSAGGLVGSNQGSISQAFASGNITGGTFSFVGGLAGQSGQTGLGGPRTISASSATGNVSGGTNSSTGGLVGFASTNSTITGSHASGNVALTGNGGWGGGLVGQNLGLIELSFYDIGSVSGTGSALQFAIIGGLAGQNQGTVRDSHATATVTGTLATAGGLVGYNEGTITGTSPGQTFANATVKIGGGDGSAGGGLVGHNAPTGSIHNANATGTVGRSAGAPAGDLFALGGLAGRNEGSIDHSTAAATVTGGFSSSGGLVGQNSGSIMFSSASGVVSGFGTPFDDSATIGGLVGSNQSGASISNSSAGGNVTGGNGTTAGGLVGFNASGVTITQSQATGNVSITNPGLTGGLAGGLVGDNFGTITNSDATGAVSGGEGTSVGGLVGANPGSIADSHATGNVTGTDALAIGGLVGSIDSGGSVSNSYATGIVTGNNTSFVGGLAGTNFGTISGSSATGAVNATGALAVGGLVGSSDGDTFDFGSNGNAALNGVNGSGSAITNSFATGAVSGSDEAFTGGLIGINVGGVSDSHATGNVTGGLATGGLVGANLIGTITNSYATGTVTGGASIGVDSGIAGLFGNAVGGLVGFNGLGTINNSHATGNVIGGEGVVAGGLIGANYFGSTTNSYATGNVSGGPGSFLGGFVGFNFGFNFAGNLDGFDGVDSQSLTGSHATGNVTGAANSIAGGFFGINLFGAIDNSFATGAVTGGAGSTAGGFGGLNIGTVNTAFASGPVSGGANSFVGGFLGVNFAVVDANISTATGAVAQSYALGAATGGANSFVGGFAAINVGSLDQTYAGGLVTGGPGSTTGGLVASNNFNYTLPPGIALLDPPGTATNSYWDRQTTGQNSSAGGTPADTAQLAPGLPSGFDPAVWGTNAGQYPFLVALGPSDTTPGQPVLPPTPTPSPPDLPLIPPTPPQPDVPLTPNQQPTPDVLRSVQQVIQEFRPQTALAAVTTGEIVNTQAVTGALQQPQGQPQGQRGPGGAGANPGAQTPPAPQPIRLNVGEGRYFYLPPVGETRLVQNEVVLQLPCNPGAAFDTVTRQLGLSVINSQCMGQTAVYRVQLSSGQTLASAIRALAAHRLVAAAQANYTYALAQEGVAESAGDASQYVLDKLKLTDIHRALKGTNISIAVIDSEIDATHPDLEGIIVDRFDATGDEDKPHPHGTGMAGAIGSHHRLMGIAPSAQLYAIRAFSAKAANAESTTFNILKGLDWAVSHGVRIVNMSFAGPKDPSLERALKAAHDKGVVLVAAAGNAGPKSPPLYPAADPNVIAVTATDIDDKLFTGANRGRYVAISAPGVDILVPAPEGTYQMTTGTSVATAHISGIVALLLERNPRLKPDEIRKILTASAKRLGPNNEFGAGLVDPVKALELAAPRSAAAPAPVAR